LAEKYDYLAPKFRQAYEFLRRGDLADLPVQGITLSEDLTVQVKEYDTKPPEDARFETHDKMFDIQFVVSGEELFGLAPRAGLKETTPYDAEKDITFYHDPPRYGSVLLRAGDFIVVSPDDAHKPACMMEKPAPVKKIIVKVRV
ncbi:MAG: YhcH/YjgK/YiaL family protein, partial [Spirochaetaceae bacterium]|nr:YhcH/YjgK/YiaL family protein [Spirochaetaceae bacterium]